jgi:cytochrome c55X
MLAALGCRMFIAVLAIATPIAGATDAVGQAPPQSRQRELVHLLKQDCGSCHGLTLRGGLGPALTADMLRAKPSESLVATIVHGRPGTAMPPWQRFVTESEARWLVQRMQVGDIDAPR